DVLLSLPLILGGVIGAQYGVGFAERLKAEQLRAGLALLVLAVAVRMARGLVVHPADVFSIEAPPAEGGRGGVGGGGVGGGGGGGGGGWRCGVRGRWGGGC